MSSICGRDCGGCELRERYGCRGCFETGGRPVWGPCRAVSCCHSQGLQKCGQCPGREGCGKPEEMDVVRQRWTRDEEGRRATWQGGLAQRAPVMVRWLPVLFWLGLISVALELLSRLPLGQGASLALSVVDVGVAVGCLVAYWKLSHLSWRLRLVWQLQIAGLVVMVAALGLLLGALFFPEAAVSLSVLTIFVAVVILIVAMVAMYQFCEGMAEELEKSDPPCAARYPGTPKGRSLACSWRLLGKCIIWGLGGGAVVLVLAVVIQGGMGILLLLLALLAALVLAGCGVAQLVMLWKSIQFFQEILPVREPLPPAEG